MHARIPRKQPSPEPSPRIAPRRTAYVVLLTLLGLLIMMLGGLAVYLGPDLWVLVNGWMQQGGGQGVTA